MGLFKDARVRKRLRLLAAVLVFIVFVLLTIELFPLVLALRDPAKQLAFEAQINELGLWGVLVFFVLQVLQVVVAFIPGEPVEVLGGLLYGPWGGFALCMAGIFVGQALVFALVRRFGLPFAALFFERKQIEEFAFLKKSSRLEEVTFLLYFIPGTPKDILCYVAGLTPIRFANFMMISGVARIPSVLSSTFAGGNLSEGNLTATLWIFGIFGALSAIGFFVHHQLMKRLKRK